MVKKFKSAVMNRFLNSCLSSVRRGGLFAPWRLCAPTSSAVADFLFFLYQISTQHLRKANFLSQKIAFKVPVGKVANTRG